MNQEFKEFPEELIDDVPHKLTYTVWRDENRYPASFVFSINVHINSFQPRVIRIVNRDMEIENLNEYEERIVGALMADRDKIEDMVHRAVAADGDIEVFYPWD